MGLFTDKNEDIFSFGIDETSRAYMLETARWGKFLAIISFVSFGLLLLMGAFLLTLSLDVQTIGNVVTYFLILIVYIYPMWALYKFSTLIRLALAAQNQLQFNEALRYLKNMFKFLGVATIVGLVIGGLMFVFGALAAVIASA